ncbi:MAG: hypothetical protein JRN58_08410 [Nitrososphaerota archaeon]|jgi:hypothetical protein|nr:hypothetical protein [Nitrososphaerota archaeon]
MRTKLAPKHQFGLFAVVVLAGGIGLFGLAHLSTPAPPQSIHPGLDNGQSQYFFGNSANNFTGWQMPAKVLVSTSFKTTHSLNGFVGAGIYVFPYEKGDNTTIHLGLYINGVLASNRSLQISHTDAHPASMIGGQLNTPGGAIANFSSSVEYFEVSIVPLSSSLPAGTTLTLTVYATSPIWVQTADSGAPSYETSNTTPTPPTLPTELSIGSSGVTSTPYPLCVGGNSNAQ